MFSKVEHVQTAPAKVLVQCVENFFENREIQTDQGAQFYGRPRTAVDEISAIPRPFFEEYVQLAADVDRLAPATVDVQVAEKAAKIRRLRIVEKITEFRQNEWFPRGIPEIRRHSQSRTQNVSEITEIKTAEGTLT